MKSQGLVWVRGTGVFECARGHGASSEPYTPVVGLVSRAMPRDGPHPDPKDRVALPGSIMQGSLLELSSCI